MWIEGRAHGTGREHTEATGNGRQGQKGEVSHDTGHHHRIAKSGLPAEPAFLEASPLLGEGAAQQPLQER